MERLSHLNNPSWKAGPHIAVLTWEKWHSDVPNLWRSEQILVLIGNSLVTKVCLLADHENKKNKIKKNNNKKPPKHFNWHLNYIMFDSKQISDLSRLLIPLSPCSAGSGTSWPFQPLHASKVDSYTSYLTEIGLLFFFYFFPIGLDKRPRCQTGADMLLDDVRNTRLYNTFKGNKRD